MIKYSFILFLFSFSLYSKNKEHIAVLPFSSQGIEEKELIIIADSLRKELSKSNKYDVMERSVLEKKLKSEGIDNLNTCDELACALVYGEFLSLKYVIQGRLSKIENTYTFSLRFIDTKNEVIIDDFTEFFTGNFESLLKKIVPKLSKKIQRIRIRQWKVEKKSIKNIEEAQMEGDKTKAEERKVSPVSTSTTLASEVEFIEEIPESVLSVSPQEESIDKNEERRNRRDHEEVVDKTVAEESKILVPSVSTSTTLAPSIEFEKEEIIDSVFVPQQYSEDDKEEEKKVVAFTPETPSETPFTKSIEEMDTTGVTSPIGSESEIPFTESIVEMDNELVSEDIKKVDDTAVATSPINSEFIQKDSKNIDGKIDILSDDKPASPSLAEDAEKEPEKLAQSKEDMYIPEDADKTLIPDIENEDPVNINDLQEEGSSRKQSAIIITSGISAAVVIPVFLILFSKKDKKEPNTFSLTVEWP